MNFSSLGLSQPIVKAVTQQGYKSPSNIQSKVIPVILEGKDVMAAAQTGTGKTAGFTLPILEGLSRKKPSNPRRIRVLILTPTRELASQVQANIDKYSLYLPIKSMAIFGGVKINPQIQKLRTGIDVLVATPGRLLDLYNQNAIKFDQLEILVLDEADRMLNMGFIHDIRRILGLLPTDRQNLMFSATFSKEIRRLAKTFVNAPVEISTSPANTTVNTIKHWMTPINKNHKSAFLIELIRSKNWFQVLVFVRTKHSANKLTQTLKKQSIKADAIHGNKSQGARTRALADFKSGKISILIATDIAARGLDINKLPRVINFDLPAVAEDYIHRIGRTGRAGQKGEAISLVSPEESKQLSAIERLLKYKLDRLPPDCFDSKSKNSSSATNRDPAFKTKNYRAKKANTHLSPKYKHSQQTPAPI